MLGYMALTGERGRKTILEQTEIMGLALARALVPGTGGRREKRLARRVERAARRLREGGICRVLTGPDFPYWDLLDAQGLRGVDPGPMCQALAAPLALAALERLHPPGRAVVALRGGRVSRPLFQAAAALCARVWGVEVDVPGGGSELADYLRREYGLPVLERERPDLIVEFSPVSGRRPNCPALVLHGPAPDLLGLTLRPAGAIPEGFAPLPLTAALWEAGCLSQPPQIVREQEEKMAAGGISERKGP
ncbi:hypothetical protein [uncultured Pseudoflavonifractor sp.]|uniref:hypothetical protein n=1 Tax=uncultured Pseudoflavonifractor sp. TaxID=1221379 RepID=UPI0025D84F47|nr:hypothetical protein [uncultured Pseudoflavonifractor sp.]